MKLGKLKSQVELNVVMHVKDNKKGFCKYTGDKRKARENMGPLLNETGDLVTQDRENVEDSSASFASAFTSKTSFQESQVSGSRGKAGTTNTHWVEKDPVSGSLSKLDTH